ncbi:MAG: hypothetical protein LC657_17930 [Desulfobacteraceae bacterium]|nr:hypothetical protein [Desulfobacteraceae bacterium]
METKYICAHEHCSYPGSTRFEMSFTSESIMDDNNVATAFCPFCKKELMPAPALTMDCSTRTGADCNQVD